MGLFSKREEKSDNPRADFSNVQGGSSSTAPTTPPGSTMPRTPESSGQTGKVYVVKEGDSLSKIARRQYGDENQWRRIFEANRDVVQDPDLIHPGQKLRIP